VLFEFDVRSSNDGPVIVAVEGPSAAGKTTWCRKHLHGCLGEVEGLQVSLAGVNDKLTQIDTSTRRAVDLGTPALPTNSWLR
jgi:GTPase SAR1 family protein